jgi:fatty-acyl-CoA synthase
MWHLLLRCEEDDVDGLIMDYQLNVPAILRRGEQLFGHKEIVTRLPDRTWHRYTYADFAPRARQLAAALRNELGLGDGDRVATFCWNHHQHLEAYVGVPVGGMVTHTLNLRLHPDDLVYIARHAGDRVLIADKVLWPLCEHFFERAGFEHLVAVGDGPTPAGAIEYEDLLSSAEADDLPELDIDERTAAAMCFTSGTTGLPKGAVYSHRAIAVHSLASAMAGVLSITEKDTVLPVVPMFHANAWGFPFTCTLVGAKQVFPGPFLDPESLLEAFALERITMTAGVPTIWMGILQELDANPEKHDVSSIRCMVVGGSAAPRSMIEAFERRHGLRIIHAWGMTETCPLGTVSDPTTRELELPEDEQLDYRARQGIPAPFFEIRARGPEGLVPWDGESMGELEVRGVWVSSAYHDSPESGDRWTSDGWFRTGDIATIEPSGYIEIQDRSKDLVKSGGEWISSVALENALMGHPAVAEAAVIAVPDPKWQERPLAVVVLRPGASATEEELRAFLAPNFVKWWLPDHFEFVEEIPKTAVGKFRKTALREQFAGEANKVGSGPTGLTPTAAA